MPRPLPIPTTIGHVRLHRHNPFHSMTLCLVRKDRAKLSNMELDLSNNDQSKKVSELEQRIERTEDELAAEKLRTEQLSQQIQALQIEQVELIENYETIIAENQEQLQSLHFHILRQNAVIVQQQNQNQSAATTLQQTHQSQPPPDQSPPDQSLPQQPLMDSINQKQSDSSFTGRRFSRPWHTIPDAAQIEAHSKANQTATATANGNDEFAKIPDDVLKIDDDQVEYGVFVRVLSLSVPAKLRLFAERAYTPRSVLWCFLCMDRLRTLTLNFQIRCSYGTVCWRNR